MSQYDVAAYIWPAYTGNEKRARIFWEEGYGEWQTVRKAVSRFPGHTWPRKPLWGYVNEADPYVMEMEINAAADHGVNVFIYDWYWYDGMPFLENCLNDGYLKARNNDRVKFYLMWANHNVNLTWDIRNACNELFDAKIWRGSVDRAEFDRVADRLIERYFVHPSYYRIDGKPVFMIYDLRNLVTGLGGVEQAKAAIESMKNKAVKAGLPGIHFQMAEYGKNVVNLSGVDGAENGLVPAELLEALGFDSTTHYQIIHTGFPIEQEYEDISRAAVAQWEEIANGRKIPYFPHVSVGWDNNPRFTMLRPDIIRNSCPEKFEAVLREAKAFLDRRPEQTKLVTINSWNEWTESSYLEPDDRFGYGYLDAVKRVFGE